MNVRYSAITFRTPDTKYLTHCIQTFLQFHSLREIVLRRALQNPLRASDNMQKVSQSLYVNRISTVCLDQWRRVLYRGDGPDHTGVDGLLRCSSALRSGGNWVMPFLLCHGDLERSRFALVLGHLPVYAAFDSSNGDIRLDRLHRTFVISCEINVAVALSMQLQHSAALFVRETLARRP